MGTQTKLSASVLLSARYAGSVRSHRGPARFTPFQRLCALHESLRQHSGSGENDRARGFNLPHSLLDLAPSLRINGGRDAPHAEIQLLANRAAGTDWIVGPDFDFEAADYGPNVSKVLTCSTGSAGRRKNFDGLGGKGGPCVTVGDPITNPTRTVCASGRLVKMQTVVGILRMP